MSRQIFCTILVLAVGLGSSLDLSAQSGKKSFGISKRTRTRLLEETAKSIDDAKVRQAAEEALSRSEEVADSNDFKELKKAAESATKNAELKPEQLARTVVAKALLDDAVKNVSEEAAKIINAPAEPNGERKDAAPAGDPKENPATERDGEENAVLTAEKPVEKSAEEPSADPPGGAPPEEPKGKIEVTEATPEKPAVKAPAGALPGDDLPKPVLDKEPQPVIPPPKQLQPAKENYTEINAKGGAFFHASQKIIVFKNDVQVDHEVFDLNCDQLEVFLYKDVKIGAGDSKNGEGNDDPKKAEEPAPRPLTGRRGDIMKAIATGYVVITKSDPNGAIQVGKCRHATYEDGTGDLTMRGMPQVQRGTDLVIATDESTSIVFTRSGDMEIHGPHRIDIVRDGAVSQLGP